MTPSTGAHALFCSRGSQMTPPSEALMISLNSAPSPTAATSTDQVGNLSAQVVSSRAFAGSQEPRAGSEPTIASTCPGCVLEQTALTRHVPAEKVVLTGDSPRLLACCESGAQVDSLSRAAGSSCASSSFSCSFSCSFSGSGIFASSAGARLASASSGAKSHTASSGISSASFGVSGTSTSSAGASFFGAGGNAGAATGAAATSGFFSSTFASAFFASG
mmetsp:Transcript_75327/g.162927  ORF Transcript_75327/g.162927 Transcript_75327/m.162927 type:complete len:219 (-) Transcript_75327:294-950(-)